MSYYTDPRSDPHGERSYMLAVEEAEELGVLLEVWRNERPADPSTTWTAVAAWPEQVRARRMWLRGHPDHMDEPAAAKRHRGFGETAGEAAWHALRKICDEG